MDFLFRGDLYRLLAGNVTAEDVRLEPVHDDEDTVAGAEAHAQVGGAPEEVGELATTGEVAGHPADVSDSLLGTNVGQGTLVRVLEGTHLLDAAEALLQVLDLGESLVANLLVGGLALLLGEGGELGLELLGLGHLVEEAGEESALLGGDLGGGSVVCDGAVADGPDVLGALDDEVLVDGKTTAGVGLCGNG